MLPLKLNANQSHQLRETVKKILVDVAHSVLLKCQTYGKMWNSWNKINNVLSTEELYFDTETVTREKKKKRIISLQVYDRHVEV